MPIIASGKSGTFIPCPEGAQQGVCCDVADLGVIDTAFGPKHKVEVVWQVSETMPSGKPFLVQKRYTLSLNEKANLRHDLESWRAKAFTEDELVGFDLERLIGVNAILNVVHNKGSKGGIFANVMSVTPLMKGMVKLTVTDYTRRVLRETTPEPSDEREYDEAPDTTESVPF